MARWEVHAEVDLSESVIQAAYEVYVQGRLNQDIIRHESELLKQEASITETMQPVSTHSESAYQEKRDTLIQELKEKLKEEIPIEEFRKEYEKENREAFLRAAQAQEEIPADVLVAFLAGQVYVPPGAELASQYGWAEYERKGIRERWGIWLKGDNAEEEKTHTERYRRFGDFEKALKDDAQQNQLIKNPYYYVQKGNKLLKDGLSNSAVVAYQKAIDLDPNYSINARYNKARALVYPEENKHNHAEAKKELEKAQELIDQRKHTLLCFDTIVGQTGTKPKPGTSEHVQHQMDILSQQEHYLQSALSVIEYAQEKNWHVEITEVKTTQELFKDSSGSRKQAIDEAACNGFTQVFSIKEKEPPPPKDWWSVVAVAMIGLAQITAGVLITTCTLGIGATLGKALISEGVSDLITSVKAGIQGGFSWAEWGLQKAISLAVSLISAGWDAIKKGCKMVKETAQNLGKAVKEVGKKSITELRKKGMKAAIQRVGVELGKGVAKECVNTLVNYGVDQLLMKNIEKEIATRVTNKVIDSLQKSSLIQDAMALDIKNENNYWQNILLQEGMALLEVEKESKVLYALKEVASNKIKGAKAAMQSAAMHKALSEILTLTDGFLDQLHKKLEEDHGEKIRKAKEASQAEEAEQQQAERQQDHQQTSAAAPPIDESDLEIPIITLREDYKSDLKNYYHDSPSDAKNLSRSFSSAITGRITSKIQGDVLRPATGALVNMGIDKMLEKVDAVVTKNEEDFCKKGAVYYHGNKVGNESQERGKKGDNKKEADDKPDKTASDNDPSSSNNPENRAGENEPVPPANKEMADKIRSGEQASIAEIGPAAAESGSPIAVYDEKGKLQEIVGRDQKGPLLKVQHTPSSDGKSGHYVPYGTEATAATSGTNNCLYDALACQTDKVKSGAELREKVANRIERSKHTPALHQAVEALRAHNPRALRTGGGLHAATQEMRHRERNNPSSDYNKGRLAKENPDYSALQEAVKAAKDAGDQDQQKALEAKCSAMEVEALEVRRVQERQRIINAGESVFYFGSGLGNAVGNNLTLGAFPAAICRIPRS